LFQEVEVTHVHHPDVEVVEGSSAATTANLVIAMMTLAVLAAVAFAVLWTRPWDSHQSSVSQPVPLDNGGAQGGQGGGENGGSAAP
jgi:hypothetical protein